MRKIKINEAVTGYMLSIEQSENAHPADMGISIWLSNEEFSELQKEILKF